MLACYVYGTLLVVQLLLRGLAQEVTILPLNFTAGQDSDRVTFTCLVTPSTISVTVINVLVNGEQLTREQRENRGISDQRVNQAMTEANVTIEPRAMNNNTWFSCVATLSSKFMVVRSTEAGFLMIQGILSLPGLEISAAASRLNFNRLSWQPPFTLNINNQEPDIIGYEVCYNHSLTAQICIMTENNTLFDFLKIRFPLEFLVTAINIAGRSIASRIVHPACKTGTTILGYPNP